MSYRFNIGQYTFSFTFMKRRPPTRVERIKIAMSDVATTIRASQIVTRNRDVAQRVVERVNHLRTLSERLGNIKAGLTSRFVRNANRTVNGVTFISVKFT